MEKAINEALTNINLRNTLKNRAFDRAKEFSEEKIYCQLLKILNS